MFFLFAADYMPHNITTIHKVGNDIMLVHPADVKAHVWNISGDKSLEGIGRGQSRQWLQDLYRLMQGSAISQREDAQDRSDLLKASSEGIRINGGSTTFNWQRFLEERAAPRGEVFGHRHPPAAAPRGEVFGHRHPPAAAPRGEAFGRRRPPAAAPRGEAFGYRRPPAAAPRGEAFGYRRPAPGRPGVTHPQGFFGMFPDPAAPRNSPEFYQQDEHEIYSWHGGDDFRFVFRGLPAATDGGEDLPDQAAGGSHPASFEQLLVAAQRDLRAQRDPEGKEICPKRPGHDFTDREENHAAVLMGAIRDPKNAAAGWDYMFDRDVVEDGEEGIEEGKRLYIEGLSQLFSRERAAAILRRILAEDEPEAETRRRAPSASGSVATCAPTPSYGATSAPSAPPAYPSHGFEHLMSYGYGIPSAAGARSGRFGLGGSNEVFPPYGAERRAEECAYGIPPEAHHSHGVHGSFSRGGFEYDEEYATALAEAIRRSQTEQ